MRKYIIFVQILIITLIICTPAYSLQFTQDDRDRLIRVEEGQKSLQKQIDDQRGLLLWGFGIIFSMIAILIGFVMWDRRTALEPAIKKE